jgi:hypothetical protein
MELLADSVKLVDGMKAGSHVFLVERDLDGDLLRSEIRGLTPEEQLEVIDRAINRLSGWARGMVELARLRVVAHRDGKPAALRQLESIATAYGDPYGARDGRIRDRIISPQTCRDRVLRRGPAR